MYKLYIVVETYDDSKFRRSTNIYLTTFEITKILPLKIRHKVVLLYDHIVTIAQELCIANRPLKPVLNEIR